MAGVLIEAEILERAEPMARPILSHSLEAGASSEASSSLEVYVRAILRAAAELGDHEDVDLSTYESAVPTLLGILREDGNWDRLWSAVPDGVVDALARIKMAGLQLVIVSNSNGSVEAKLARVHLSHYFDVVIDSGTVGVEKPDPEIFRIALERAGCAAHEVVHIGDLESIDVRGAEAAGIRAILLDPYGDWQDASVCARPVSCETARSVAEAVERLLAET